MVIYDKYKRVGEISELTLKSGKYYTLRFATSRTPDLSSFKSKIEIVQGKEVLIKSATIAKKGFLDILIYVPNENPIILTIAIIAIASVVLGYGVNIATKNLTRIVETVFNPMIFVPIVIVAFVFMVLKVMKKI